MSSTHQLKGEHIVHTRTKYFHAITIQATDLDYAAWVVYQLEREIEEWTERIEVDQQNWGDLEEVIGCD